MFAGVMSDILNLEEPFLHQYSYQIGPSSSKHQRTFYHREEPQRVSLHITKDGTLSAPLDLKPAHSAKLEEGSLTISQVEELSSSCEHLGRELRWPSWWLGRMVGTESAATWGQIL